MKIWFRQHLFALGAALGNVGKGPASFLFNVLVVAIALTLPFVGLTLLENVRPVSEQLSIDPEVSVFLKPDVPRDQALALQRDLQRMLPPRTQVRFVPREQALEGMQARRDLADVIDTLGENPLPDSYVIRLSGVSDSASASAVDSLVDVLRQVPGVDEVRADSAWIKKLGALLRILRLMLLFLAGTLGMVVVAVVFNTIRLQVLTQREEIAVAKLIGATDQFIHRPFYYTGALLGLAAGALALGAVALALRPLNEAVAEFARLSAFEFQLAMLSPAAQALLLALSATLGLMGAVLSVQRHLRRLS
jgi:cell division transport system permease protein